MYANSDEVLDCLWLMSPCAYLIRRIFLIFWCVPLYFFRLYLFHFLFDCWILKLIHIMSLFHVPSHLSIYATYYNNTKSRTLSTYVCNTFWFGILLFGHALLASHPAISICVHRSHISQYTYTSNNTHINAFKQFTQFCISSPFSRTRLTSTINFICVWKRWILSWVFNKISV